MIAMILVIFVAIEHMIFGYIEMWGKLDLQSKAFDFAIEDLENPAVRLALKNQGIYNLSFALISGYFLANGANNILLAGLMGFVVIVGIYGGATVTKKIYLVQALPALIALVLLIMKN